MTLSTSALMNIAYAKRSKFTVPCTKSIATQRELLEAGQVIYIPLGGGGYAGQVIVTIHTDSAAFETDWAGRDPTRFPARLKAAATALRDSGCAGVFTISHAEGVVSVQRDARLAPVQSGSQ